MATSKAKTNGPTTLVGKVLARLDDIESWFRQGYKTKEVIARLHEEGIPMHPVTVMQLLKRYGKNEATIRRQMAVENGLAVPLPVAMAATPMAAVAAPVVASEPVRIPVAVRPSASSAKAASVVASVVKASSGKTGKATSAKPADAVADLKAKEERRVEFRPNARPNKKELLYGEES